MVPRGNHLWSRLDIKPPLKDNNDYSRRECWVGEGWGQCKLSLGMVHYPGLDTCRWWHSHVPGQVLQLIVRKDRILFSNALFEQLDLSNNYSILFSFNFLGVKNILSVQQRKPNIQVMILVK